MWILSWLDLAPASHLFALFFKNASTEAGVVEPGLFFGDQHEATDNLYGEEFNDYLRDKQLTRIDNAWSRDQDYKVYVQDKMREKQR